MRSPMMIIVLALLFAASAFATNQQVVSYQSQVVTAFNANDYNAQVVAAYHNDLVSNLKQGYGNQVSFVVVAEPQHCSVSNVNQYMSNNQVKVVVQKNVLSQHGLTGYNQSVVQCVRVVKVQNKVVQRRVLRRLFVRGVLFGARARQVKVAVQDCR